MIVTLDLTLSTCNSQLVTVSLSLSTYQTQLVTLNLSLLTIHCHTGPYRTYMSLIYVVILGYFVI